MPAHCLGSLTFKRTGGEISHYPKIIGRPRLRTPDYFLTLFPVKPETLNRRNHLVDIPTWPAGPI
jgi:hypothetical protein